MARDFDGTDDEIQISGAGIGATDVTTHGWLLTDTYDEASFAGTDINPASTIFNTRNIGTEKSPTLVASTIGNPGNARLFFSSDSDSLARGANGTTVLSTGVGYFLTGTFEHTGSGDHGGNWDVYVNGVKDNPSANNFGLAGTFDGTFTGSTWRIGNHNMWTDFTDAKIGYVSLWKALLSSNQIAALGRGVHPFFIGTTPFMYIQIFGNDSPEPVWGTAGYTSTVSGPVKHTGNPPVEHLSNYISGYS